MNVAFIGQSKNQEKKVLVEKLAELKLNKETRYKYQQFKNYQLLSDSISVNKRNEIWASSSF